jgi:ATP-dependent RNA helicase HelY
MAVNLTGMLGRRDARELLETSLAQFQADRAVVGIARQVRRNEEGLAGYREAMTCHLGDFAEYAGLRRSLKDREAELSRQGATHRRAEAAAALEKLRPGDVIRVPAGRRAGLAVVLDPGMAAGLEGPRPTVLTADRQVRRLTVIDFPVAVEAVATVRIPKAFNARSPQARRDLASSVRATGVDGDAHAGRARRRSAASEDTELSRLRAAIRQHPCHGCDEREEHARWGERYWRLQRDTEGLQRRVAHRTHTIARTFDRVCALLESLDYLAGDTVTPEGTRLGRIYGELDLLTAECLRAGLWEELSPPELAACASALVFESRQSEDGVAPHLPGGRAREVLGDMVRMWARLEELEGDHGLSFQREPDLGFAWPAYRWASGHRLEAVLADSGLQAGDFVRWVKQLVDLLGQVAAAAPEGSAVRGTARSAIDAVRRGVVAYSSVA